MAHARGRFAKKIEAVHWTLGTFDESLAAGTAASTLLAAQHLPETILRSRGEWVAGLSGAIAPGVGVRVACGFVLVPEGTGTTVLWSPISDGDAPWMWWDSMHFFYEESVIDVVASGIPPAGRRVIDSKAMRRSRNQELQFVAEQETVTGFAAGSVQIIGSARVLAGS